MSMPRRPILIMAGGTGGHVYPALAVADHLRDRGVPLLWLGTRRGLEARVVPANGYTLLTVDVTGLRGKGYVRLVLAPFTVLFALCQSLLIMMRRRPAVVLGMGGFASGPGGLAAFIMRIPLCIHEQNAVAGLTNRLLAPLANTVMQAFPHAFRQISNALVTGNPVRAAITSISPPDDRQAGRSDNALRVLILGGSQGARILNEILPQAFAALQSEYVLEIWHQTGEVMFAQTRDRYQAVNCTARTEPFIEDMAAAYAWADVVICRAGALTIAEIAAAGIASILVPYPHAVDDHQTANARYLTDDGAAVLLPQTEFTLEKVCAHLTEFCNAREKLLEMARKARSLAKPEATCMVADVCMEVAYAG